MWLLRFIFINKQWFITHYEYLNINESDVNILKSSAQYRPFLKGLVLADRGFASKLVRQRLDNDKNNIFNYERTYCRFISPHRKSEKKQLNLKERRIYRKRWTIETLFQKLKDKFEDCNLDLTGKYCRKEAKIFVSCL